ncbi:MAG TPA: sigma factor, partial [Acetobacteraceae bacterium]|nr:sigma factor [Acetobacteraceae bacterium]
MSVALPTWRPWSRAARPALVRHHASSRRAVNDATDATLSALMAASQGGDARAYQALLRAVVPFATATIRRQGVPPDRVDDVVQDVLLTIHRARATYDPMRPFLPWLRAI